MSIKIKLNDRFGVGGRWRQMESKFSKKWKLVEFQDIWNLCDTRWC